MKLDIILILFVSLTYGNIYMKSYTKAGNYLITKEDYSYSDTIIIEMWGAGGGGANPCYETGLTRGGGGGSYLKAWIKTKLLSFNMTVGKGGKGGFCEYIFYSLDNVTYNSTNGMNGEHTFMRSLESNPTIYLMADGGYSGDIGGAGGLHQKTTGSENFIISNGGSQYYFYDPTTSNLYHGGNAAFGGFGGQHYTGTCLHNIYCISYGQSGQSPGGGGFCLNYNTFGKNYNGSTKCGDGADGTINIYYFSTNNTVDIISKNNPNNVIFFMFITPFLTLSFVSMIILLLFIYICERKGKILPY